MKTRLYYDKSTEDWWVDFGYIIKSAPISCTHPDVIRNLRWWHFPIDFDYKVAQQLLDEWVVRYG